MALELTNTNLPSTSFAFNLDTTRPGFTFAPEGLDTFDFSNLALDLDIDLSNTPFDMSPYAKNTKDPVANILGDFMGNAKAKAQKKLFQGAVLKTVGSAADLFDSIINFGYKHENINTQAGNTKIAADNQMAAIDNQVMYTKNQIMDRFTKLVANNTVQMAAKNLRVSAGTLLEETKSEAYDINQDFAMLDSKARLQKIELENIKGQAEIARSLAKSQQWSGLVQGLSKLGLNIATGGGTGESFGNLYSGYKMAKAWESGQLNELY